MNKSHKFLARVVRPVLLQMEMHSLEAEIILMMIATHESAGLKYRRQQGGGPALSYFQIEPATLWDVYKRYLERKPVRRRKVLQFAPDAKATDEILDALENNDEFACALARMKLAMVPDSLPAASDLMALAQYAKDHWNTSAGKATPDKYLNDLKHHLPDPLPAEWRFIDWQ